MAKIILWGEPVQLGCPAIEIAPGSTATFLRRFNGLARVDTFGIASLCKELHIVCITVSNRWVAEKISVSDYLCAPPPDDELVAQVRKCFRYQDHTLEEYRAVIGLFTGPKREVAPRWPLVEIASGVEVVLQNPTSVPALASVEFGVRLITA